MKTPKWNPIDVLEEVKKRQNEKSGRYYLLLDLYQARKKLHNYKLELSVKAKEPAVGQISFQYEDLSRYDYFKKYVWDYGFVVPVKAGRNKKILRGEKKLKYNNLKKSLHFKDGSV